MSKVKYFFEQSWLLIISAFCFGLLLAVANAGWSDRIIQNEIDKRNRLMTALIADANSFGLAIDDANIPGQKGRILKTDIYKAVDSSGKTAGFAFIAVGAGFADKIKLVIAVDSRCEKLYGYKVLASNETPGFGDKIKEDFLSDQFINAPLSRLELAKSGDALAIDSEIIAITGATVSSEAVVKTFNMYIEVMKELLQKKGLTK
jgi:electron transport complex protein RnfG